MNEALPPVFGYSVPLVWWLVAAGLALLGLGALLGWLFTSRAASRRLQEVDTERAVLAAEVQHQEALASERAQALQSASDHLTGVFSELADRTLASRSEAFLKLARENLGQHQVRASAELNAQKTEIDNLVKPITAALERTEKQIAEIEKERHAAFGSITRELQSMQASQQALRQETHHLVNALRRPEVRGQWGEMTLRRLAELAGMVEHCDFTEQTHQRTEDGAVRPDMLIRMPESRQLIVDAKAPLDAYISAVEASDDAARRTALARHAQQMRNHIKALADKRYWAQFENSPEFVILFVPGDQFLSAAVSERPDLIDEALAQKVILATPTSLVALLKAVGYGWRQLQLAENAAHIRDLAESLHKRLGVFAGHLALAGRNLGSTVNAYNKAVGSLERSVLPGARKFRELGVEGTDGIETLPPIEPAPRAPSIHPDDLPGDDDA